MDNRIIPTIYEVNEKGVKAMDIYSRLLRERIIFVNGEVNHLMSDDIVAQLLLLESEVVKDISLYINSPGGCVVSGTSIIDTMNLIKSEVSTVVTGYACSMGAVIASAGQKGKRFVLPNAQVMLHQVSAGTRGNVQDMKVSFEHTVKINERLMKLLASNCGISLNKLMGDTIRDLWLDSDEAVAYGVIDGVLR